jgi:hypothetical protein
MNTVHFKIYAHSFTSSSPKSLIPAAEVRIAGSKRPEQWVVPGFDNGISHGIVIFIIQVASQPF